MALSAKNKFQNEQELAKYLVAESSFLDDPSIVNDAEALIQFCRDNKNQRTKLDSFMEEYGLSNSEGIDFKLFSIIVLTFYPETILLRFK